MDELLENLSHLMNYREQAGEEGFVELMAAILAPWPGIAWERGPDLSDPRIERLSLSLSGPQCAGMVDALAARLPLTGPGWVIGLGIPPRDWEMFFVADFGGRTVQVEGSAWAWRMDDDGERVRLTIASPASFDMLADEELAELAGILASGELGESNLSAWVRVIDVSRTQPDSAQWFPMAKLRQHFAKRFPECDYAPWLAASR